MKADAETPLLPRRTTTEDDSIMKGPPLALVAALCSMIIFLVFFISKETNKTVRTLADVEVAKIFYINLEESRDRRVEMERQLRDSERLTGVPFERVPAVRGESIDDLAGELGSFVVAELKCDEKCSYENNKGLCCFESLDGGSAARALLSSNFTCSHETAHTWLERSGSHSSCFHMMANWASHMKALRYARNHEFHQREHVLIVEDDLLVTPTWLSDLRSSRFAERGTPRVLESMLAFAANNDDDWDHDWDYIRVDLDAFDVAPVTRETKAIKASILHDKQQKAKERGIAIEDVDDDDDAFLSKKDHKKIYDDDDDDAASAIGLGGGDNNLKNPLMVAVDWTKFPSATFFAFGAGALLIKVKSLDKIINSVSDCFDIDFALNIGSARKQTKMATLAAPVFVQNLSLAFKTTLA